MCVNIYIYCSKIAVESWGSKHSGADFLRFRVPQDNTCHEPLSNLGHSILPKIAWHCEWGRSIKVLENVSLLAFLTCRSTSCESFECSLPCLTATPPACPLPRQLTCPSTASLNISGWALLPHMSVTFQAGYHMFRLWPPSPLYCRVFCCFKGMGGATQLPFQLHLQLIIHLRNNHIKKKKSSKRMFIFEIPISFEIIF